MIAACGQMTATTLEEGPSVWEAAERLAGQAASAGTDLLVLPETTYPAYWLESAARYMQPDIERTGAVLERYSRMAARHSLWLIVGVVEEDRGKLFNSAAVIDRGGRLIGMARKNFLWDCDNRWFAPGESMSVFDSEFGRLGVLICADARAPEIAASLVCGGARFIAQPTAWVNASRVRRTYRNIQTDFLIRARAMEFGVPFLSASKSGREGNHFEYVGQSLIVAADGTELARAPVGGEHLIVAEVEAGEPRAPRLDERTLGRLLGSERSSATPASPTRCRLKLKADADAVAAALEAAGARVARLSSPDLGSFAPGRCAAVDGAQVIVARGRVSDDVFVRSRAAENRVYVITAAEGVQYVVHPEGSVMWRESEWSDEVELDLSIADDKRFTPETDMWQQRRTACYRLQPAPVPCGG